MTDLTDCILAIMPQFVLVATGVAVVGLIVVIFMSAILELGD